MDALTARGAAMLGQFAEVFGVMLMTTFANLERVTTEMHHQQREAMAGRRPGLDPTEVNVYKVLQKSYTDASRNQLAALLAGSKIDYKHKGSKAKKQEA